MAEDTKDQASEPTPVPPAPADAAPSSTGVVAGEGDEPDEAKPTPNQGE